MSPRARIVLAMAALAPGCTSIVAVDPPGAEGGRSALVVTKNAAGQIAATAIDLDQGWAPFSVRGAEEVQASIWRCPLDRLGLKAGPQSLQDAPAADPLLPNPAAIVRLPLEGGDWISETTLPAESELALRRLPVPPDQRCRSASAHFEGQVLAFPQDERTQPAFALSIDDHATLIGAVNGSTYLVTLDGAITPQPVVPGHSIHGIYRSPAGAIWLVDGEGQTWRGDLTSGFTLAATAAVDLRSRWLTVTGPSDPAAPFELFAELGVSGDRRIFQRFDGTRWTKLADEIHDQIVFLPAVAWIGPSHAIAIGVGGAVNTVLRYRNGATTSEVLGGRSGLSAIMQHTSLGTVIGRDLDGLYRYDGQSWQEMRGHDPIKFVRVFLPMGDGFLFGGSEETNYSATSFGQWYPGVGFCPREHFTDVAATLLARLGPNAILAVTLADPGAPMGLTIIHQTAAAEECSGAR